MRLALFDALLVGEIHQLEVAPPERLVLAAMPAQKLGQQPAGVLGRASIRGIVGNARAQSLRNLRDMGELLR